jgi:D-glycero-beta-D-manno-heptose-7-phosphate kinase
LRKKHAEIISDFPRISVAVLGDFMLDEFVMGEISRVSREAPVLILKYVNSQFCPGGAANTVANAASLGASVFPVGLLGNDEWAAQLMSLWPDNVSRNGVIQDNQVLTTKKSRILAGAFHSTRQQVVRMDYEHELKLTGAQEEEIIRRLGEIIPLVQALIISDYSLGNLNENTRREAIRLAGKFSIPVVVDSRDNSACYPGATAATPNISEVEASLGIQIGSDLDKVKKNCEPLLEQWKVKNLVVTMGKLGLALVEKDRFSHIPAWGDDAAVDVSGAGDTVVSTYTCALATGAEIMEAASLANIAGGLAVMKKGTSTVSPKELQESLKVL